MRADVVESRDRCFEVLLLGQAPHGVEHLDTLEAVVERAFAAELGLGPKQGEVEAQAGERSLEPRADLGDDLLEPSRFDLELRDQVGEELDEGLRVAVEGAAREDEGLEEVLARRKRLDLRRGAHATGDGGDSCRDLRIVLAGGTALGEGPGEQGQQVFLLGRESREVGADVEVGDAVGTLRVELDLRLLDLLVSARHILEFHRDVDELERGQGCQVLLRLLLGLEAERVFDNLPFVFFGEARFCLSKSRQLCPVLALLHLRVGHDSEEGSVRIVEKLGRDEVLEEAPFFSRLLQVLEIFVEVECFEWVAAVVVGRHGREEQAERVGEACVGALSLLELEVVDGRVDL